MHTSQESKEVGHSAPVTQQLIHRMLENRHFTHAKTNQWGNHQETLLFPSLGCIPPKILTRWHWSRYRLRHYNEPLNHAKDPPSKLVFSIN